MTITRRGVTIMGLIRLREDVGGEFLLASRRGRFEISVLVSYLAAIDIAIELLKKRFPGVLVGFHAFDIGAARLVENANVSGEELVMPVEFYREAAGAASGHLLLDAFALAAAAHRGSGTDDLTMEMNPFGLCGVCAAIAVKMNEREPFYVFCDSVLAPLAVLFDTVWEQLASDIAAKLGLKLVIWAEGDMASSHLRYGFESLPGNTPPIVWDFFDDNEDEDDETED